MADISITNVIWSFNNKTKELLVLLLKNSEEQMWGLPTTYLRKTENAEESSLRLVREKIGVDLPLVNTEQLATFTDIHRAKKRELALTYMIYLPDMPGLVPGYGADDAQWFSIKPSSENYLLQHGKLSFETLDENIDRNEFYLQSDLFKNSNGLISDHALILRTAFNRIRNRLDYSPTILRILGPTFTLKKARIIYSILLRVSLTEIDNSNFRKTHKRLFLEVGTENIKGAGRPGKVYRLK
ncbi:NrtR DNA-binding winged helix domain-containing protein [Companilactobacillus keshanensis]|uniref:NUDIX domain-containing protein n=1 Tax=Companilactobacillus keshanensis TaxID=2486003 RepID=A0ABW4BXH2_9LACO|nr:NUDIX domain-containing protein [Companilactobacillus keshanensis]